MARLPRAVVPGLPHHVAQRGNRRQLTFFNPADYLAYLAHVREQCDRFDVDPMDERYTLAAARYIELNPVRAGIVERPEDYPWSSARAHLAGRDDAPVRAAPLLAMVPEWARFLETALPDEEVTALRAHLSTGRPLGSDAFVDELELRLDRPLRPRKPGPLPMLEEELVPSDLATGRAA